MRQRQMAGPWSRADPMGGQRQRGGPVTMTMTIDHMRQRGGHRSWMMSHHSSWKQRPDES